MSKSNIKLMNLSFKFILYFLTFITIKAQSINPPIDFTTINSNATIPIDNPPQIDDGNNISKKYEDLLISEKELEEKYQELLDEHQKNTVQIQINNIYYKALISTIVALIIILLIIIIIKIYKVCFTNNLTSELLIRSISQKLFNQKKENENKSSQNNINYSCYNLLDSNMNINDRHINDTSFSSCGKNYDAPAMAFN